MPGSNAAVAPLSSTVRGRMPAGAILRVCGSKKGVLAYPGECDLKPHRVYLRGEPTSVGSKVLARSTYFLVEASNAPESDFPLQVRETTRFLKRHMRDLKAVPRHRLHAVIDFAVSDTRAKDSPLLSWRFPVAFVRLLNKAAIDVEISLL